MSEALLGSAPTAAAGIPWRRVWAIGSRSRSAIGAMVVLGFLGSVAGLVPPLALGRLVDALTRGGARTGGVLWVGVILVAVLVEAGAYFLSDGFYARAAADICRELRSLMFAGLLKRRLRPDARTALGSRFVADAQTLEQLTVAVLDQTAVAVFDLFAAFLALLFLDGWLVAVAAIGILAGTLIMRLLRRPAAAAGTRRQEALEAMNRQLGHDDSAETARFAGALTAVAASERRLGWVSAANRHGSLAIAGLGPVLVLMAAAAQGSVRAGVLVSAYLLAVRAFGAAENLTDVTLDVELARGAVARCFALIDG